MATSDRSRLMRFGASTVLLLVLGAGCTAGSEEEFAKSEQALAESGPWHIPAATLAIGDTMYVEYTGAGPWVGTSGCGGGMTPGAVTLRDWLNASFPQISTIGGYSCRPIVGVSTVMSVHATGRALDIMIPTISGAADNDAGDPIGAWLIAHAEEIGIQYIIWDRWSWNASRPRGSKSYAYTGTHPHNDHLHVELSIEGSRERTPWFSGSMEPPAGTVCDALGADGGVIDDTNPCFSALGPAAYWRTVTTTGHGGSLRWTNAFTSDTPSNTARWHIDLRAAGDYAVEVFIDPTWGVFDTTRYTVRHNGESSSYHVDQSAASGWTRLGVLAFAAGAGQDVNVFDNASGPVPSNQHIVADAIRLVRIRPSTPADPPPVTDPGVDPTPAPVTAIPRPTEEPVQPMEGDPMVDDDPLVPITTDTVDGMHGGCSVARPSSAASGSAWVVFALCLLVLPLRRRRGRGA